MATPDRPAPAARLGLRAACLFGVLVGIFGMHGLAAHGVTGSDLVPYTFMAESHQGTGAASPATNAAHALGNAAPGSAEHPSRGMTTPRITSATLLLPSSATEDGMDMGMTGLCLAILLVGAVALSLWPVRHRPWSLRWVWPRPVGLIERPRLTHSPPSLHALSIQRC